jgi:hypothetical protein
MLNKAFSITHCYTIQSEVYVDRASNLTVSLSNS